MKFHVSLLIRASGAEVEPQDQSTEHLISFGRRWRELSSVWSSVDAGPPRQIATGSAHETRRVYISLQLCVGPLHGNDSMGHLGSCLGLYAYSVHNYPASWGHRSCHVQTRGWPLEASLGDDSPGPNSTVS